MTDFSIKHSVLMKMPFQSSILRHAGQVKDQYGDDHEAILVMFRDEMSRGVRHAHFDLNTGEYLGDTIVRRTDDR